jgi:hypothetical protein
MKLALYEFFSQFKGNFPPLLAITSMTFADETTVLVERLETVKGDLSTVEQDSSGDHVFHRCSFSRLVTH